MTPENFCYWLQGLLELQPDLKSLDEAQTQMVRDHLGYVFTHVQAKKAAPTTVIDPLRQYQDLVNISQVSDPTKVISFC